MLCYSTYDMYDGLTILSYMGGVCTDKQPTLFLLMNNDNNHQCDQMVNFFGSQFGQLQRKIFVQQQKFGQNMIFFAKQLGRWLWISW